MQEERFWSLASLQLSGEATPEELAELGQLLSDHPELALRLEIFTNIWRQKQYPEFANPNPLTKEDAFNRHLQRLSTHLSSPALQYETTPHPRRRWITTITATTAAAAAILAIAFFVYRYNSSAGKTTGSNNAIAANTVSTRPGSKSRIQLPDGTQVWLNADSRLTYNVSDPNRPREAQLTGEAYFDVAKDKSRPFLIHTPTVDIVVLGTAFNVRSYSNDRNTETALFQGSVEVTLHNNPDKKIILRPNEKLTVHNDQLAVSSLSPTTPDMNHADEPLMTLGKVHFQKKDSSIVESLWTKNQLAFDSAPLDEIALQIERWYDVKVTINSDRLKRMQLSATFGDVPLNQVLEALSVSGNFNYTIRQKDISITP
ncbi:FecR family protein [Puia sp.]|uniref:FecR family protein n=1 Tax=Puia sp. TaxID=2045100 RepID=UPI002F3EB908